MPEETSKTISSTVGKALNSVIEPINARLSNPLIGSFAISFILLNWKPILFLIFDSHSMLDKFLTIDQQFYGNGLWGWCMYLFIPLAISVAYVLLLPRLENVFENINLAPYKSKVQRLHDLKVAEYDNLEIYAEKQNVIENVKANYMKVQELNQKIELLRQQLDAKSRDLTQATHNFQVQNQETTEIISELNQLKDINKNMDKVLQEAKSIFHDRLNNFTISNSKIDVLDLIYSVGETLGIEVPDLEFDNDDAFDGRYIIRAKFEGDIELAASKMELLHKNYSGLKFIGVLRPNIISFELQTHSNDILNQVLDDIRNIDGFKKVWIDEKTQN